MPVIDDNKHTALALSRAITKGDWATVNELISDDFIYVADGRPPTDKAAYLHFLRHMLCAAMTEMDMAFLRVVAEGDLVAVDYCNSMVHSGSFLGIAATGRRVRGTGQFMRQLRGGQVIAEWHTTNMAGLMAQLIGGATS